MTTMSLEGKEVISRRSLYGAPLNYQGELLNNDQVVLVFSAWSVIVAGAVVRDGEMVFSSGRNDGIEFIREFLLKEFGLNI